MYKVVEFVDIDGESGGGISIIRQEWLTPRKRNCMWPPHKLMAKFNKCLIGKEIPDDTWEMYAIKRIFYETDNLSKAREKAKKAENESDIASENEKNVRTRKKPRFYDSDTSETGSDENLISYPTPPGTGVVSNAKLPFSSTFVEENNQEEQVLSLSFTGEKNLSNKGSTEYNTCEKNAECLSSSLGLLDVTVTPFLNELGSNNSQALDVIAKHLAAIEIEIKDIKNSQNEVLQRLRSPTATSLGDSLPDEIIQIIPCDDQQALTTIESWVSVNENGKLMATYLSFIGGNKIPTIVRRILEKLFTNKLALTFNWTGKNNKTALRNLHIISVIRDAVRLNKIAEKATDSEINDIVSNWFRFTKDRNGGREARRISQL